MSFDEFEIAARELWACIPAEYKEGVDGMTVERRALPHPTIAEVYTLGECVTEAYPSDFEGPETIRSLVVLYWGSFREVGRMDPDLDWEDELWETLTHELRHHLETLADEDALGAVDYAADQNFRRERGDTFDPWFYRAGEQPAPGVWHVERTYFIELFYGEGDEPGRWIKFDWHGERLRAPRPDRLGDVCFVQIDEGVPAGPAALILVLVRRRGWVASLRAFFRRESPEVVHSRVEAERMPNLHTGSASGPG